MSSSDSLVELVTNLAGNNGSMKNPQRVPRVAFTLADSKYTILVCFGEKEWDRMEVFKGENKKTVLVKSSSTDPGASVKREYTVSPLDMVTELFGGLLKNQTIQIGALDWDVSHSANFKGMDRETVKKRQSAVTKLVCTKLRDHMKTHFIFRVFQVRLISFNLDFYDEILGYCDPNFLKKVFTLSENIITDPALVMDFYKPLTMNHGTKSFVVSHCHSAQFDGMNSIESFYDFASEQDGIISLCFAKFDNFAQITWDSVKQPAKNNGKWRFKIETIPRNEHFLLLFHQKTPCGYRITATRLNYPEEKASPFFHKFIERNTCGLDYLCQKCVPFEYWYHREMMKPKVEIQKFPEDVKYSDDVIQKLAEIDPCLGKYLECLSRRSDPSLKALKVLPKDSEDVNVSDDVRKESEANNNSEDVVEASGISNADCEDVKKIDDAPKLAETAQDNSEIVVGESEGKSDDDKLDSEDVTAPDGVKILEESKDPQKRWKKKPRGAKKNGKAVKNPKKPNDVKKDSDFSKHPVLCHYYSEGSKLSYHLKNMASAIDESDKMMKKHARLTQYLPPDALSEIRRTSKMSKKYISDSEQVDGVLKEIEEKFPGIQKKFGKKFEYSEGMVLGDELMKRCNELVKSVKSFEKAQARIQKIQKIQKTYFIRKVVLKMCSSEDVETDSEDEEILEDVGQKDSEGGVTIEEGVKKYFDESHAEKLQKHLEESPEMGHLYSEAFRYSHDLHAVITAIEVHVKPLLGRPEFSKASPGAQKTINALMKQSESCKNSCEDLDKTLEKLERAWPGIRARFGVKEVDSGDKDDVDKCLENLKASSAAFHARQEAVKSVVGKAMGLHSEDVTTPDDVKRYFGNGKLENVGQKSSEALEGEIKVDSEDVTAQDDATLASGAVKTPGSDKVPKKSDDVSQKLSDESEDKSDDVKKDSVTVEASRPSKVPEKSEEVPQKSSEASVAMSGDVTKDSDGVATPADAKPESENVKIPDNVKSHSEITVTSDDVKKDSEALQDFSNHPVLCQYYSSGSNLSFDFKNLSSCIDAIEKTFQANPELFQNRSLEDASRLHRIFASSQTSKDVSEQIDGILEKIQKTFPGIQEKFGKKFEKSEGEMGFEELKGRLDVVEASMKTFAKAQNEFFASEAMLQIQKTLDLKPFDMGINLEDVNQKTSEKSDNRADDDNVKKDSEITPEYLRMYIERVDPSESPKTTIFLKFYSEGSKVTNDMKSMALSIDKQIEGIQKNPNWRKNLTSASLENIGILIKLSIECKKQCQRIDFYLDQIEKDLPSIREVFPRPTDPVVVTGSEEDLWKQREALRIALEAFGNTEKLFEEQFVKFPKVEKTSDVDSEDVKTPESSRILKNSDAVESSGESEDKSNDLKKDSEYGKIPNDVKPDSENFENPDSAEILKNSEDVDIHSSGGPQGKSQNVYKKIGQKMFGSSSKVVKRKKIGKSWTDLSDDLMQKVAENLDVMDRYSLRATNRQTRSVVDSMTFIIPRVKFSLYEGKYTILVFFAVEKWIKIEISRGKDKKTRISRSKSMHTPDDVITKESHLAPCDLAVSLLIKLFSPDRVTIDILDWEVCSMRFENTDLGVHMKRQFAVTRDLIQKLTDAVGGKMPIFRVNKIVADSQSETIGAIFEKICDAKQGGIKEHLFQGYLPNPAIVMDILTQSKLWGWCSRAKYYSASAESAVDVCVHLVATDDGIATIRFPKIDDAALESWTSCQDSPVQKDFGYDMKIEHKLFEDSKRVVVMHCMSPCGYWIRVFPREMLNQEHFPHLEWLFHSQCGLGYLCEKCCHPFKPWYHKNMEKWDSITRPELEDDDSEDVIPKIFEKLEKLLDISIAGLILEVAMGPTSGVLEDVTSSGEIEELLGFYTPIAINKFAKALLSCRTMKEGMPQLEKDEARQLLEIFKAKTEKIDKILSEIDKKAPGVREYVEKRLVERFGEKDSEKEEDMKKDSEDSDDDDDVDQKVKSVLIVDDNGETKVIKKEDFDSTIDFVSPVDDGMFNAWMDVHQRKSSSSMDYAGCIIFAGLFIAFFSFIFIVLYFWILYNNFVKYLMDLIGWD